MTNLQALDQFIRQADTEETAQCVTEFWEAWLTNPENDSATAPERANKLYVYKQLILFLKNVKAE